MKVNENFLKIQNNYLFATIDKKVGEFRAANPSKDIISLGIGDTTRPLPQAIIDNLHKAVDDMANEKTYKGYPPYYGYDFLVSKIKEFDFESRGIKIDTDEIFVSDGAKSDTGNIGDIFSTDNVVAVCDPIYPVYIDTNVMAGRSGDLLSSGLWSKFVYLPCGESNNFLPELPAEKVDIIYLCFPNNPTGMAANRDELKKWVDYANKNGSVILFDAAYESFITDNDIPHSIYEIEGAKTCAIEFRSFSKTAGFTGVRCAYTIIPKELKSGDVSLNQLWRRRQATKFNGVSYITQKGAEAVYSQEGREQVKNIVNYYLSNAKVIGEGLKKVGFEVWGGVNSPYTWFKVPQGITSWEFFDLLLEKANVVGTPGSGFGPNGEGFFRLTGFGSTQKTAEAIDRIKNTSF